MIDIVCCPTPFLVGLLSSSLPKLKELPVEEVGQLGNPVGGKGGGKKGGKEQKHPGGKDRGGVEGRGSGGEEGTGIFLFVTSAPFYPALILSPWEGSAQLGVLLLSAPGNPGLWKSGEDIAGIHILNHYH